MNQKKQNWKWFLKKKRITPNINRKVFIDSTPTYQILNYQKNLEEIVFFNFHPYFCKWLMQMTLNYKLNFLLSRQDI